MKVLATDLDGTLLRSDGTVSPRTLQALEDAEAAGIAVVFVTGRPPRWLDVVAEVVGGHGIVIAGNGAFIVDAATREVISTRGFAPEVGDAIISDLRGALPGVQLAVETDQGFRREVGFESTRPDLDRPEHAAGADAVVAKLLVRDPARENEEFVLEVAGLVGDRGQVAHSGIPGLAEVSAAGVTKAAALATWCAEHGWGPDDVVACGDMPNDLPMLEWAGHAVAVANAHPEVLSAADEVIGSNDEDGVATVLERLVGAVR